MRIYPSSFLLCMWSFKTTLFMREYSHFQRLLLSVIVGDHVILCGNLSILVLLFSLAIQDHTILCWYTIIFNFIFCQCSFETRHLWWSIVILNFTFVAIFSFIFYLCSLETTPFYEREYGDHVFLCLYRHFNLFLFLVVLVHVL